MIWISHDLATVSSLAEPPAGDVRGPHHRGRAGRATFCARRAIPIRAGCSNSLPAMRCAGPGADADSRHDAVAAEAGARLRVRVRAATSRRRLCSGMPALVAGGARAVRCHHPLGRWRRHDALRWLSSSMSPSVSRRRCHSASASPRASARRSRIARCTRSMMSPRRFAGRSARAGRRIRLREVDARPHHRRHPAADRRHSADRRRRR